MKTVANFLENIGGEFCLSEYSIVVGNIYKKYKERKKLDDQFYNECCVMCKRYKSKQLRWAQIVLEELIKADHKICQIISVMFGFMTIVTTSMVKIWKNDPKPIDQNSAIIMNAAVILLAAIWVVVMFFVLNRERKQEYFLSIVHDVLSNRKKT